MASVHDGHRERLRARYAKNGLSGFTDHELLELLLTYAIPRRNTNEPAHLLLDRFGSINGVLHADMLQLMSIDGIGENAAIFLRLISDLQKRIALQKLEDPQGRIRLKTPYDVAKYGFALMASEPYEVVRLVCLNKSKYIISSDEMSAGSLTEARIYQRVLVENALLHRAHTVILLHNHPSGNPTPSQADDETTAAVKAAFESVGIPMIDHIIVGFDSAYCYSAQMALVRKGDQVNSMSIEEYKNHYLDITEGIAVKLGEYMG